MNRNVTVSKQKGAALVVGLIMLLVMTLLGITSMSSTRTELRIAGNLNNHSTAFQTAALMIERALVDPKLTWSSSAVTQTGSYPAGYVSTDGKRAASFNMKYAGCRRSATASSLTGGGGAALVQEISATGSVVNSNGDDVGVSRQVSGYVAIAAGCG